MLKEINQDRFADAVDRKDRVAFVGGNHARKVIDTRPLTCRHHGLANALVQFSDWRE